jgi:hypothetical protein
VFYKVSGASLIASGGLFLKNNLAIAESLQKWLSAHAR